MSSINNVNVIYVPWNDLCEFPLSHWKLIVLAAERRSEIILRNACSWWYMGSKHARIT